MDSAGATGRGPSDGDRSHDPARLGAPLRGGRRAHRAVPDRRGRAGPGRDRGPARRGRGGRRRRGAQPAAVRRRAGQPPARRPRRGDRGVRPDDRAGRASPATRPGCRARTRCAASRRSERGDHLAAVDDLVDAAVLLDDARPDRPAVRVRGRRHRGRLPRPAAVRAGARGVPARRACWSPAPASTSRGCSTSSTRCWSRSPGAWSSNGSTSRRRAAAHFQAALAIADEAEPLPRAGHPRVGAAAARARSGCATR